MAKTSHTDTNGATMSDTSVQLRRPKPGDYESTAPKDVLADADRWLSVKGVPGVSESIRMVRRLRDALRAQIATDA